MFIISTLTLINLYVFIYINVFTLVQLRFYILLLERMELICRLATPPTPASKQERESESESEDEEQRVDEDFGAHRGAKGNKCTKVCGSQYWTLDTINKLLHESGSRQWRRQHSLSSLSDICSALHLLQTSCWTKATNIVLKRSRRQYLDSTEWRWIKAHRRLAAVHIQMQWN